MGAVVRFFAAVHRGRVVRSFTSVRQYRYAVLHFNQPGAEPVVIWRTTFEGAQRSLTLNRRIRNRVIVSALETSTLLPVGTLVEDAVVERLQQRNHQPQTTNQEERH